jgi:predicted SprT family Zn-dependent metalloprotease
MTSKEVHVIDQEGDDKLKLVAQRTANAFARQYNKKHGTRIPVPVPISFELELTHPKWAGAAFSMPRSISLNMTLYRDNVRETLNETIPHEVAHLADFDYSQATGVESIHGPRWQSLMTSMAKLPTKRHTMNTAKAVAVYKAHKAELKKVKGDAEVAAP